MNAISINPGHDRKIRIRKRIVIGAVLFIVYSAVFQMFYNQVAYKSLYPYRDFADLAVSTLTNFVPMAVILGINLFVIFCLTRIHNALVKALIDCAVSFAITAAVNCLFLLITAGTRHAEVDWAGTMFNNMLIFISIEALYYVDNFQRQQRANERLRAMALQYEFNALKAQINPHFLFNSLNLLYSLVEVEPDRCRDFIMALSNMYRYILTHSGQELVSLRDELDFLKQYSAVLSMRYYNQMTVEIVGEDGRELTADPSDQIKIIPFTMQLLLENVTKHNVISSRHHMHVTVTVGTVAAVFSNPIVPRESKTSTGIGLSYLTRLYDAYGRKFAAADDKQCFKVYIPYITTQQS